MKKTAIFFAALALVFAASCQRIDETFVQDSRVSGEKMTFEASFGDNHGTKTAIQPNGIDIYWTPGDAINLFYGTSNAGKFESTITAPAEVTEFSGTINIATGSSNAGMAAQTFWGVYPYAPGNTCSGDAVTLNILGTQVASPGTFGKGMNPSVANSPGLGLSFYNVGSWFCFSVGQEGITSAAFSGNAGEILAGRVTVTMDPDMKPVITNVENGLTSITVTPEDGGAFVPGQLYYITLIPQVIAATGYTLTLYKGTKMAKCVVSKASGTYAFNRSEYRKKANADAGLTWEAHNGYLCFTASESGTIAMTNNGDNAPDVKYCTDGTSWIQWNYSAISVPAGSKIYFKGNNDAGFSSSGSKYSTFVMTGKFAASGSVQSLIYGDDFENNLTIPSKFCFYYLFRDCTSLITAPALPATTLAEYCYSGMFCGCTSLTSAPALPATTLAESCYDGMFWNCTSLNTAPELPATTLVRGCYSHMFIYCTSLTSAPALPATTMASSCYSYMFSQCSSLISAPALPATTLAPSCYSAMFSGCSSLTSAPALPATTLASSCYSDMFRNCYSLETPPTLPATTLETKCYGYMFYGCTGLTTAPELPATTLAEYCYQYMFRGCTSLNPAPELPARTLEPYCYQYMFYGCTSLTTTPILPARTLVNYCYKYMFANCSNLQAAKIWATDISAEGCLDNWLLNVSSSQGTFLQEKTVTFPTGPSGIPENWIKVVYP